jgi:hypothetical protein
MSVEIPLNSTGIITQFSIKTIPMGLVSHLAWQVQYIHAH